MNLKRHQPDQDPRTRRRAACGFTLVEVLVVIVIIAALASVLMMVISNMRRSASSAICVTKMAQIGSTFLIYSQEQNGRLPTSKSHGTLFSGQGPWYNRDDRRLQSHIGEYLGARESDTWSTNPDLMTYDPSFAWSALLANGQKGSHSIVLNSSVKIYDRKKDTIVIDSPFRGYLLSDIREEEKQAVFIEVDQKNTNAGWKNQVPPEPIHGKYRNCLYFDWHVGRVPVKN